jgi:hypothetical protein
MKQIPTPDHPASVAGALAALRRARRVAEETARRTHTALIVMVDGKIVREVPADVGAADADRAAPATRSGG